MFSELGNYSSPQYQVILIAIGAYALYARYGYGISKYPGPLLASITNFWRLGYTVRGRHSMPMVDLHKKYGNVVRYGPNMLSFSDPRAIQDIYMGTDQFPKSDLYAISDIILNGEKHETLFSTRNPGRHGKMRRAYGPAFSMTAVAHLEIYVDETINFFMKTTTDRYANKIGPEGSLDIGQWMQYFAFDVLGQLVYGERHGFIERNDDVDGIIGVVNVGNIYNYNIGHVSWMDSFLYKNPMLNWLAEKGYIDLAFAVIPFARKHITKRENRPKTGVDESTGSLLDRMLALQENNPEMLSNIEIVKLCAILSFAGSDTTAITISALFYYLVKNPGVYSKLLKEIDGALPAGSARLPFVTAQTLPYFEICLKETFRVHPATAFNFERVVPAGGRKVGKDFIPGGTIVGMNPWTVHRNQDIFGKDADIWRPERWLDTERAAEMNKYMFHFGAGSHMCIGRNISMLEIYKIVPVFLRTFEISLEKPYAQWKLYNTMFAKPTDCNMRLRSR
ncbi:cytochrome P450 [Phlyctema vagabunda]|uniref:Cytochrome P450 n=1 Tax=Phlyctema vagabunda TaxID=108571 RepID=A0ABR4PCR0_9HELO